MGSEMCIRDSSSNYWCMVLVYVLHQTASSSNTGANSTGTAMYYCIVLTCAYTRAHSYVHIRREHDKQIKRRHTLKKVIVKSKRSGNTATCTNSRPRARWYQLRGLPLVGSECVFPQCHSSFVITRGSAKPSTFGLPVHLSRVHQKCKQKKWNSCHSKISNRQMPNGTTKAVQHPPKVQSRATNHKLAQIE